MNAIAACPARAELQEYLLDRTSEATALALDEHLAACARCRAELPIIPAEDDLVADFRARAAMTPPNDPLLDRLASNLQDVLRPYLPTSHEATPPADAAGTPPPDGDALSDCKDWTTLPMLAPPIQPDELGRLGHYSIRKVLGAGGMGMVFLAEDSQLRRLVAVKAMRPALAASASARERFLREARAAAALKHDHVVTIHQVGEEHGVPFLTMELLEGESLEDRLKRENTLAVAEVLRIGAELAEALEAAHARGLIHRDVKPGNVWLEARPPVNSSRSREPSGTGDARLGSPGLPRGDAGQGSNYRVKVLDFGLARGSGDAHVTAAGMILGTPSYMAPEQARGEGVDGRSDLFSLGVVLYRMTTGELPFKGKDAMATLTALAVDTPRAPHEINPEVPKGLSDFILELLAKDPAARPVSGAVVAKVLERMEERLTAAGVPTAKPVNPATALTDLKKAPRPSARAGSVRRRRVGLAVAAAILAVLLPVGYYHGGTVVRFAANKGQVEIRVDDPLMEVTVKENGAVIRDPQAKRVISLDAGDHELKVLVKDADGEMESFTRHFTIRRGGTKVLDVKLELEKEKLEREQAPKASNTVPHERTAPGDSARLAVEWALAKGGTIYIRASGTDEVQFIQRVPLPTQDDQVVIERLAQQFLGTGGRFVKEPPRGGFEVVGIFMPLGKKIPDAELAKLKDLKSLRILNLPRSGITDTGLAYLTGLVNLRYLDLSAPRAPGSGISDRGLEQVVKGMSELTYLALMGTQVSGAGLAHLRRLTNLEVLWLYDMDMEVGDAGLRHLDGLRKLKHVEVSRSQVSDHVLAWLQKRGFLHQQEWARGTQRLSRPVEIVNLDLSNSQVTDAGLKEIASLHKLRSLDLSFTRVTGTGLVHLKGLANLTQLHLMATHVTDAGLADLKVVSSLINLDLRVTRVSDAGLGHLLALKNLKGLNLASTRVSPRGIANLLAALPGLNLSATNHARDTAEAILALGGHLSIRRAADAEDRVVKAIGELPDSGFNFTRVRIAGIKKPLDALTAKLRINTIIDPDRRELDLRELDAADSSFGDKDLAELSAFKNLKELSLARTNVSRNGVQHLQAFTALQRLVLDGLVVQGSGVAPLKGLSELTDLSLAPIWCDDDDLLLLKNLKKLRRLVLNGNPLRGSTLASLKDLPELTELRLACKTLTNISAHNLAELKHLEKLSLAGSSIGDDGLKHLRGLTALKELDLTGTMVTEAGAAALQKALPGCRIRPMAGK
jgi:serine/threonine protein kinase/Leucine-rich repeat (LRR) protein